MISDPADRGTDWKVVEELYHEALSRPKAERSRFLESACQGNEELRREVESLLASLEQNGALFDVSAMEVAARMLAGSPSSFLKSPPQSPSHGPDLQTGEGMSEKSKEGAVLGRARKIFHYAPWWMYLLAAVFTADCLLRVYCHLLGPEEWGFGARSERGRRVIALMNLSSSAERAGLKPGDVLLSIDGIGIRNSADLKVSRANREVGRSYVLEIEREGRRLQFVIQAERGRFFESWEKVAHALWQVDALLLLAIGLFIAFARPFNPLARAGALALASLSVGLYLANPPPGYAAAWRGLPFGLGALLWIPSLCIYLAGPILLTFFVLFPRPLFRARWPWALIWLPALCLVPTFVHDTFLIIYRPLQAYGNLLPPGIGLIRTRLFGLYGLAALAALAVHYYRLSGLNDRRRLRVLFFGGAAGVLPGVLRFMIWRLEWPPGIFAWLASGMPDIMVAALFALFPISFAYSILKHRLLDIRLIIRQSIQYAVTRGAMLAFVPALAVILVVDLLVHGDRPFIAILKARGWVYAAIGALAVGTHSQRRRWGEALDRRFFREQYDARRLLRELAGESLRARSFARVASAAAARVREALHPEFVAIMRRASSDPVFRCLESSPAEKSPPPLTSEINLVSRLRTADRAIEVTPGESIRRGSRLPDLEGDWIRSARASLIVPVTMPPGRSEALLVLGAKRSEEPYTREDRELLEAVAANLALPFEREALAAAAASDTFEECPECGACYDAGIGRCAKEGAGLSPVHMPRTLAGRYRLERRRGGGGMGTVYEARDEVLGRRVAVKVMREDFVFSAAAARRFEREARAMAAFDHPNVVTVHDFGVEAGTRAFLVMELLEGVTLREYLRTHGRTDTGLLLSIFRPVCLAVDAAHRHQLIHRDLKPENIFLLGGAEAGPVAVKILDFGVAKFLDASEEGTESDGSVITESGVLVGTPGYMSPEQLLGERPAVSWDVWALAVTVYETLTGAIPFPVKGKDSWRRLALAGKYTPLSEHLAEPPVPWKEFFACALAADREMRPQSAAEFLRSLEQALA